MSSYAVLWSEPRQDVKAGKLELDSGGLRFEGSRGRRAADVHRVGYGEIERVRIGRQAQDRLSGRPSVVLDLAVGGPLRIGLVDGPGYRAELADTLTRLAKKR
jgi:hypothetical protein